MCVGSEQWMDVDQVAASFWAPIDAWVILITFHFVASQQPWRFRRTGHDSLTMASGGEVPTASGVDDEAASAAAGEESNRNFVWWRLWEVFDHHSSKQYFHHCSSSHRCGVMPGRSMGSGWHSRCNRRLEDRALWFGIETRGTGGSMHRKREEEGPRGCSLTLDVSVALASSNLVLMVGC